jgi:hypothetical protein
VVILADARRPRRGRGVAGARRRPPQSRRAHAPPRPPPAPAPGGLRRIEPRITS